MSGFYGDVKHGDAITPGWMQNVEDALGSGNPSQLGDYIIFYDSDDSEYKARNGTTGKIDFHNDDLSRLLRNVIDTHSIPTPTTVYCKGYVQLYDKITLDNPQNFKLIFERLRLQDDDAQIIIQNKTTTRPTIIEAYDIATKTDYTGDAVYIYNAHSVSVNVGKFAGTGRTGSAIKLCCDHSQGMMDIDVDVGRITGYDKGLWLVVGDTDGYIGLCDFRVKHIGSGKYGLKAEARTTGGLFNNNFWIRFTPIDSNAIGINFTGKCNANTFWDYEFWDVIAGSTSYYADSNVLLTRFIGGMVREGYFNDNGTGTSVLENLEINKAIYSNLANIKSGTSTGTAGEQTIAHNLPDTPTLILLSNIDDGANPYQSSAADATNIYITAVNAKDYAWYAEYKP